MKMIQFTNGDAMPSIGLGTWKAKPGDVYKAVKEAVRIGYRHIDCAPIYGNEPEIGRALGEVIDDGIVTREQLWITSKLWNNLHAPGDVEAGLEKTLADLGIDYLDLFLIHWPIVHKREEIYPKNAAGYLALEELPIAVTWKEMENLADRGLCRHIGVSNFSTKKLENLAEAARIKPEMNQVELHPYLQQKPMLDYCHGNGIHLTAYSPLGSMDRPKALKAANEPAVLEDDVVKDIADKHSASPAQVLIGWAVQRGTAAIPKSAHPKRLRENLDAAGLVLDSGDMEQLTALDRKFRYVTGEFWVTEGGPYTLANIWDE